MRELYKNGVLVEQWDDAAATYTRFESGVEVESRPYTTAEQEQADARQAGVVEASEKQARREAREALLDATLALTEATHTPGDAWAQPVGVSGAYPVDATVTHDGKEWVSLTPFNVWEPPTGWREVVAKNYPKWVRPTGAHDAYNVGDRVTYLWQDWECMSAANVYAPGIYGWTVI